VTLRENLGGGRFERIRIPASELKAGDVVVPAHERQSETPEHGTGTPIVRVDNGLTRVLYGSPSGSRTWSGTYAHDAVFCVDRPVPTIKVEVELTQSEADEFLLGVSTARISAIGQIAAALHERDVR
jgi:hypothetical protein